MFALGRVLITMDDKRKQEIGQEMLFGLPNAKYLQFVARYFSSSSSNDNAQHLQDPFSINLPDALLPSFYLERSRVHDEIKTIGTKIIRGKKGSGKSTVVRIWTEPGLYDVSRRLHELIVPVGMSNPVIAIKLIAGEESLLTSKILTHLIFDTFWSYLICNDNKRGLHLPSLRSNQEWMITLRWFYANFPPLHRHCVNDFELRTWLHATPYFEEFYGKDGNPEDILRELIHFIISSNKFDKSKAPLKLHRIRLLVDGTVHHNSAKAIQRLINDAEALHDLFIPHMEFLLFIDSAPLVEKIKKMNCVSRGEVRVYEFPLWEDSELTKLLSLRIKRSGDDHEYDDKIEQRIPDEYLTTAAKNQFTKVLLDSFLPDDRDPTPLHALRLARAFLAACARCWPEDFPTQLTEKNLVDLADIYWSAVKEELL